MARRGCDALPVIDDACASALALHMLYHVPDPARAVAELRRVVRPGGTVLVALNDVDHMDTFCSLVSEAAGRTDRLPWPSDELNLGHGDLFERVFADANSTSCAQITLDAIEPPQAYASSARELYEAQIDCSCEIRERLAQAAHGHLARHGAIDISTHTGVFVCIVGG